MRKFNFNKFRKEENNIPAPSPKPRFSAYRTIITQHDQMKERLKDAPSEIIKN
jgi:hypothetical protein